MFKGIKNLLRIVAFGSIILVLALVTRLIMGGKKALADAPVSSSTSASGSGSSSGDS